MEHGQADVAEAGHTDQDLRKAAIKAGRKKRTEPAADADNSLLDVLQTTHSDNSSFRTRMLAVALGPCSSAVLFESKPECK